MLSPTYEIVPRFVLYINFAVVRTLLMTHFMKYICIKHIRRGEKVSVGKNEVGLETICLEEDSPTDFEKNGFSTFFQEKYFFYGNNPSKTHFSVRVYV